MSPHTQVNASPITKLTRWLKFLGKNIHLVGSTTLCAKSEVILVVMSVTVVEEKCFNLLILQFNICGLISAIICYLSLLTSITSYLSQNNIRQWLSRNKWVQNNGNSQFNFNHVLQTRIPHIILICVLKKHYYDRTSQFEYIF